MVHLQQQTGGKTVQNYQLSIFFDLQYLIRKSSFHRKYYLLFQALPEPGFPDRNTDVGCTGYSNHAMLRAFIVKHLEQIKSVPRLIEFLDAQRTFSQTRLLYNKALFEHQFSRAQLEQAIGEDL